MEVSAIMELITTVGFPIAGCIGLGLFILKIYNDMKTDKENARQQNLENMEKVQARCKEREDKLYEEIKENRAVNARAIETISQYANSLDVIKEDIKEIKSDITVIMNK
jgi:septal ring factor EnvC (AmiA/AmiB activator)